MGNILISLFAFIINVILFNLVGIMHTFAIAHFIKGKIDADEVMIIAERKSKPWYPFYAFGFSLFAAYFYMCTLANNSLLNAFFTGSLWSFVFVVYDFSTCLFTDDSRKWSFNKTYIKEQPWTALMYMALYIAPIIAHTLVDIDVFVESTFSSCPLFSFFYIM